MDSSASVGGGLDFEVAATGAERELFDVPAAGRFFVVEFSARVDSSASVGGGLDFEVVATGAGTFSNDFCARLLLLLTSGGGGEVLGFTFTTSFLSTKICSRLNPCLSACFLMYVSTFFLFCMLKVSINIFLFETALILLPPVPSIDFFNFLNSSVLFRASSFCTSNTAFSFCSFLSFFLPLDNFKKA